MSSNAKKFLVGAFVALAGLVFFANAAFNAGKRSQLSELKEQGKVVSNPEEEDRLKAIAEAERKQAEKERQKKQEIEEQQAIFSSAHLYSICSPDGVMYWSRYGAWDARSHAMSPRFKADGTLVLCDYKTNEIVGSPR